jgi:long-chain acyl-CoA synthetase
MLSDQQRWNVGYLMSPTALSDPDRIAIIDTAEGIPRTITYGALDKRLNRVASYFRRLGIRPGDRVAVLVGNRTEFIEVVYACFRGGFIPAMVNTKLSHQQLRDAIVSVGASAIVLDPDCTTVGEAVGNELHIDFKITLGKEATWSSYEEGVEASSAEFEPPLLQSTAIADFCFTSGSSGKPKAVVTSHRAILLKLLVYGNLVRWMVGEDIRTLITLPIFHANGRLSIGCAFQTGGMVVIQKKFDASVALSNISKYRISYFLGVAPAYAAMLEQQKHIDRLDFSALRYLYVGSASSGGEILPRIAKALQVKVLHSYGSTEAGVVMQAEPKTSDFASCGRPLPGVEVKLIDPETHKESDVGELWIKSEWLASGYWERQDLTEQKFVDGWYLSGDLFERDASGLFTFRGRVDDMFNVGGEKVYPKDVEFVLEQHPHVFSACVASVPHPSKGEVPAAVVVAVPGTNPTEGELRDYCLANGPAYAHPRRILFAGSFPLAHTGKIDRLAVKKMLIDAVGED